MTTNQTAHSEHNDPTPATTEHERDGTSPEPTSPALNEALTIIRHILATTPTKRD